MMTEVEAIEWARSMYVVPSTGQWYDDDDEGRAVRALVEGLERRLAAEQALANRETSK